MSQRARRIWKRIGIASAITVVVLFVIGDIVLHRATPILKGRIVETLSTRFGSRVELDNLEVSLIRGLDISGQGLRIFPVEAVVAAGASKPLIGIYSFHFHSGITGLFFKPMHVDAVTVTGMAINIPPRQIREQAPERASKPHGKIKIVVDRILCDDSRLVIGTDKPDKEPKTFVLRHVELRDVGPKTAWPYTAILINPVPRGDIHANGAFGPWQSASPGDSYVTGHYTFDHADLNTIEGLGGILSSTGQFKGPLNRIAVQGTTQTPDFSLDTANHPVPLETRFDAIVDGTTGDTYLQSVQGKLGQTNLTVRGEVITIKGKGHREDLDVDVPSGAIQDFLDLAVKTQPPVLTGAITTKFKLLIEPGKGSVSRRLKARGDFDVRRIHFSNPAMQDKVDMLSLRARGEPKKAKPGAPDVNSFLKGNFSLSGGRIVFRRLNYTLPGAQVRLSGVYSLDGQHFDFSGKVLTKATLRKMVASWWKSWLLTPISPFFKKDGAGAEIPVTIHGTRSAPKFGLDLFGHSDKD